MSVTVRRAVCSAWILLGILMLTLAPAISGAVGGGPLGADLCVSAAAGGAGGRAPADAPHLIAHCPYCALHADLAPPSDPRLAATGRRLVFRVPARPGVPAPRADRVWSGVQSRAPPSLLA